MRVSVEEIFTLQEKRNRINTCPVDEIEFTKGGKLLKIDKEIISEFRFTGLATMDFITSGFYEQGLKDG